MGLDRRCGYRGSWRFRGCRVLADWRRTKADSRDCHAVDPTQTERANPGSDQSTCVKARCWPAADKRAGGGARPSGTRVPAEALARSAS